MKKFTKPAMDILRLPMVDVICTSGGGLTDGGEGTTGGEIEWQSASIDITG